jgi:dihydroorotate dehydrogenase
MYKLLRNILFWFDAEEVHYFSMNILKLVCKVSVLKKLITHQYTPPDCPVNVFGFRFKNPAGLGAGFDKNAKYLNELEALGFGFMEVGTVTPLPQRGNDKPRLFRLPKDKALINRMGFNNDGVKEVAKRMKEWKEKKGQTAIINGQSKNGGQITNYKLQTTNYKLIIGGNIGKNKDTPNEDAWKDYEICFLELFDLVDYFVVNVSSPNTPGLRELQQKDSLRKILTHLQDLNGHKKNTKPILLKISPDLILEEVDDIIDLSIEINLDGLIVANTTIKRDQLQTTDQELQTIGAGGLSGKPLKQSSTQLVEYICKKTDNKIQIIASGGIFDGDDAKQKVLAGASLVQVWTGFIYEGPSIVKNICKAYLNFADHK